MSFPENFFLLSVAAGALGSGLSLPLWRNLCRRLGLLDDPGFRKIHTHPVPLAGGFAVLTGLLSGALVVALVIMGGFFESGFFTKLTEIPFRLLVSLATVVVAAVGMVLLGGCDDHLELKPAHKFLGQILMAIIVVLGGVQGAFFVLNPLLNGLATVVWIVVVTNVFNLSDNMNGLCGGLGAIGALFFGIIYANSGHIMAGAFAGLILGALLGFLPYNYPRATVFLGDAGSHLVGYLMAVLPLLPHFYADRIALSQTMSPLTSLAVLAVPFLDTFTVFWLRTLARKPFWIGDTQHFSHQLVRVGLGKPAAVAVLWSVALLFGWMAVR
jgi:UDP-GlcNAc:undecaprenyl-phosphate/decaprenyl-phosphate GlcNAc-1-phosphate transferase